MLTGAAVPITPTVRVAALPTVAGGLLVQALARLHQRRPHAGVSVRIGDNPELLAWLKSGEMDVAVGRMAEPAMMQGVSFELLYAESLAVVTPAASARDRWRQAHLSACAPRLPAGCPRRRHRAAARSRGVLRRPRRRPPAGPDGNAVDLRCPRADPGLRRGVDHPAAPGPARPRPPLAPPPERPGPRQRRASRHPVPHRHPADRTGRPANRHPPRTPLSRRVCLSLGDWAQGVQHNRGLRCQPYIGVATVCPRSPRRPDLGPLSARRAPALGYYVEREVALCQRGRETAAVGSCTA